MRFANHNDMQIVWNERLWHVQGEILVLQPWRPIFDQFTEKIQWVDLWIRISRFPSELINFESIATLLSRNNIGSLVRLDQCSLLRKKIMFVRECVKVDISKPLKTYAQIKRHGGSYSST